MLPFVLDNSGHWGARKGERRGYREAFVVICPALARLWPGLAHAAIDTVFQPACLNCRQSTGAAHSLCASCWAQVRFIERPFCERLGTPFAMDLGNDGLLSPEAVANPPVYNRARAVAHFEDGPVRQLVHRLKIQRQNGTCQTARGMDGTRRQ